MIRDKNIREAECPNCKALNDVEPWEEGECYMCETNYWWEEFYDEDDEGSDCMLVWDNL